MGFELLVNFCFLPAQVPTPKRYYLSPGLVFLRVIRTSAGWRASVLPFRSEVLWRTRDFMLPESLLRLFLFLLAFMDTIVVLRLSDDGDPKLFFFVP